MNQAAIKFELEAEGCESIQELLPTKGYFDIPWLLKGYYMLQEKKSYPFDPCFYRWSDSLQVRRDLFGFQRPWPLHSWDMQGLCMPEEYQAYMNSGETVFLRMENYMEHAETLYKLRFLSQGKVVPVVHAFPCYKSLIRAFRKDANYSTCGNGWAYQPLTLPDVPYYVYALRMRDVNRYVTKPYGSSPSLEKFNPEEHNAHLGWRLMYMGSILDSMLGIEDEEDYVSTPGINVDYQVVISLHPLDDLFRIEV